MTTTAASDIIVTHAISYLRRLVAADPMVDADTDVTVANVDHIDYGNLRQTLLLDLSDGTSLRLDVERSANTP